MIDSWKAYLAAVIEIEIDGVTWVGEPLGINSVEENSRRLPALLKENSIVITAWNPNGKSHHQNQNRALNNMLERDLRSANFRFVSCLGRDESGFHFEESFLVPLISNADEGFCLELAEKYSQDAVFRLRGDSRTLVAAAEGVQDVEQVLTWSHRT